VPYSNTTYLCAVNGDRKAISHIQSLYQFLLQAYSPGGTRRPAEPLRRLLRPPSIELHRGSGRSHDHPGCCSRTASCWAVRDHGRADAAERISSSSRTWSTAPTAGRTRSVFASWRARGRGDPASGSTQGLWALGRGCSADVSFGVGQAISRWRCARRRLRPAATVKQRATEGRGRWRTPADLIYGRCSGDGVRVPVNWGEDDEIGRLSGSRNVARALSRSAGRIDLSVDHFGATVGAPMAIRYRIPLTLRPTASSMCPR
jgi:hypothetical protein